MTDDGVFDEVVADTYDRDHGGTAPEIVAQTVSVLADLADGGPALEFAVGTGRIALPLSQSGVAVSGVELSSAMLARLRQKPGASALSLQVGDMATTRLPGSFSLVYLVFNTIDNLTTQSAQLACFENAAAHLAPGGRFVVETLVPPLQRLPFGETRVAFDSSPTHWGIDEIDVTTQTYQSHHMWIEDGAPRKLSVPFRYVWPSELDLMARFAGLDPEHRWQDWTRAPFTRHSRGHVSVWRKPVD